MKFKIGYEYYATSDVELEYQSNIKKGEWYIVENIREYPVGYGIFLTKKTNNLSKALCRYEDIKDVLLSKSERRKKMIDELSKFKAGDVAVCIDASYSNDLTEGKEYTIITNISYHVVVMDDFGNESVYKDKRFCRRKSKIDNILKDI